MANRARVYAGAALMLVAGVGMTGAGIFELVVQETGAPAMARITDCRELGGRYHSVVCTGAWTGGNVASGRGHVATGTVDGASESDVGQTLPVRVSGGRAYTLSRRIPMLVLAFGLAFLAYGITMLRAARRANAQTS